MAKREGEGVFSFQNQQGPPTKRKRIVSSCSQCRKKKVKCDKGRPHCKVCIQADKADLCTYQEPEWSEEFRNVGQDYYAAANVPMALINFGNNNNSTTNGSQNKSKKKDDSTINGPMETTFYAVKPSSAEEPVARQPAVQHPPLKELPQPSPQLQPTMSYRLNPPNPAFAKPFASSPMSLPQVSSVPGASYPTHTLNQLAQDTYPRLPQKFPYNESNMRGTPSQPQMLPLNLNGIPDSPSTVDSSAISDTMTFYDFHEPVYIRAGRLVASGPLSLASIIKKDPFLRVTLLKTRKEKGSFKLPIKQNVTKVNPKDLVKQIIVDKENVSNAKADEAFKARLLENETLDEVRGAGSDRKDTQVFGPAKVDYERETIMKIEEVLPNQKLLWMLYDRFSSGALASMLPFVNEKFFREKIQDILGQRTDEEVKVQSIKISRRFDFAYIGILLIMIRLTYLTVSKTANNTEEEKYILENPIGMSAVNVAQMCVNQFRLLRRGAIPLLQCCLFMRYYHKFAPEDGDGSDGGDSEVFLGMLLQMANSIGLNRDLSNSHMLKQNVRLINIGRFVWHEIVTLDLHQSLTRGNPILVNELYFDTEVPKLLDDYETACLYPDVHKASVVNYQMSDEINKLVRPILVEVMNIKVPVKISELMIKISKLELFLNEANFGSMANILSLPITNAFEVSTKIFKMKNYIELKTALYSIYYNVYIKTTSMKYLCLHKMVSIAMEIVPLSYFLLTINNGKTNYFDSVFGSGAQLILLPTILTSLHKIAQLLIGFMSRSLDIKYNYPNFIHAELVSQIFKGLKESFGLVRDGLQSLSSIYYHAWRSSKGFAFINKLLDSETDNLWDKSSPMNQECLKGDVDHSVNHLAAIPEVNEMAQMTAYQLEQVLDLVNTKKFEEPVLKRLHTRSKKSATVARATPPPLTHLQEQQQQHYQHNHGSIVGSTISEKSSGSTPPTNGFHVNKNIMSDSETDRLWFQRMASNTSNLQNGEINPEANPLDESLGELVDQDTKLGAADPTAPYGNIFGALDFEKFLGDTSPYDLFGDIPFYQDT